MGLNRARWIQSGAIFAPRTASNSELIKHGWTINGNPKIVDGPFAKSDAWEFDGNGDYLEFSKSLNFLFVQSKPWSLCCWYKNNGILTEPSSIFSNVDAGGNAGFDLRVETDGSIKFNYFQSGGSKQGTTTPGDLKFNIWSHIVWTYDGSGNASGMGVYVNGKNVNLNESGSLGSDTIPTEKLTIGRRPGLSSSELKGKISDLLIFKKTLTSEEINQIYNNQVFDYDKHLVSFWNLDDPNPRDLVGNNHGVGTSLDSTNIVDGHNGRQLAIDFDGTSDYITAPDSDNLSFTNGSSDSPFSVFAWIYPTGYPNVNNGIFGKDNSGSSREWALLLINDGEIRLFIKNQGGDNQQSVDSLDTFSVNQWALAGATYDGRGGGSAANGINLYKNGIKSNLKDFTYGTYTSMSNTSATFEIGRYASSGSNSFSGKISKIFVFNKELTELQVKDLYNRTRLGLL